MLRFLSHLTTEQLRWGYLNCLVLVASRQLDRYESLLDRFVNAAFPKVYLDSEQFLDFKRYISEKGLRALLQPSRFRGKDRSDPSALLKPEGTPPDPYISEFWAFEKDMYSWANAANPSQAGMFIDLARQVELLGPGYDLTELGALLQLFNRDCRTSVREGRPHPNPLKLDRTLPLQLFFIYLVMRKDILIPFILKSAAEIQPGFYSWDGQKVLLHAVDSLLETLDFTMTVEDALETQKLRQYREERLSRPEVHRKQLRSRYELLIDLHLVEKAHPDAKDGYRVSELGHRAIQAWNKLYQGPLHADKFIEENFFGAAAAIFNEREYEKCSFEEQLWYFGKSFEIVGRDMGFTPGRTLALLGCFLAMLNGHVVELPEIFDTVYEASKTEWTDYLQFSGGSRFDREFVIKVIPGLCDRLEKTASISLSKDLEAFLETVQD